ncbi:hypothetical protein ScPMuIL_007260 [Solemya velum]
MTRKRIVCPFLRWFILIGFTGGVEIDFSFKQPDNGFFLKSPYNKFKLNDGSIYEDNFIITGQSQEYGIVAKTGSFQMEQTIPGEQHIAVLNLMKEEDNYVTFKDQHIIFHVPTETFHPGTRFEIPVKLEAEYDLQNLIMRARIRNGLKIVGLIPNANSPWNVHIDIKDRQKTCTISASLTGTSNHIPSLRIHDIFSLLLEVDDEISDMETARIIWSIEYERNSQKEFYTSRESRLISRINLQGSEQERIVLVHKNNEILNFAILTGQRQDYPLHVYAVTNSGKVSDVSHLTACHSAESDVIKVEADCTSLYVDGTESRGSHNATIIAKSGRYTTWMQIRVWVPEEMLDIELTDSRLSQIQGWKVTRRKPRGLNNYLTHSLYLKDDADRFASGRTCQPRFQQSLVDIFTRFLIQTSAKTDYFKSKKASFKVTHLLSHRLRISDPRIAKLDGVVVYGDRKGRTEIQVLSPAGRVMAAKEIRVGNDKVVVERLIVELVTGISLDLSLSEEVPGALTATATVENKILSKYQEGILDISIHFSDNTNFPLEFVAPQDYFLEIASLNTRIIGIAPYVKPYQPRIVSYGQGHGELLKVIFKLGYQCEKKKSRPLAIEYITLDADFQQRLKTQMDPFQSDAHFDSNRASDRHEENYSANGLKITTGLDNTDDISKLPPRSKFSKLPKTDTKDLSDTKLIPIDIDFAENLYEESPDYSQTKQEPLRYVEKNGLTPLEIGMYVLLAVFCVAIAVFMINCIMFMVRYKRKRMPKGIRETVSQAHDWVWIGRATLERNAVNTQCSQTLMPEEDFNGNRTRLTSGTGSGQSSGSSSAQSSNRNSTVSTYKGSECSIRITANPHPAAIEEANNNPREPEPQWDYEEMGMTYDQLMDYFANLKESNA